MDVFIGIVTKAASQKALIKQIKLFYELQLLVGFLTFSPFLHLGNKQCCTGNSYKQKQMRMVSFDNGQKKLKAKSKQSSHISKCSKILYI